MRRDNGQTTATTSHLKNGRLCLEDRFHRQTWQHNSLELAVPQANSTCELCKSTAVTITALNIGVNSKRKCQI